MESKLIHNWKEAWKMISVQLNTIGIAISAQYALMYDHLKEIVPPKMMMTVVAVVFIAGIVARITKQSNLNTVTTIRTDEEMTEITLCVLLLCCCVPKSAWAAEMSQVDAPICSC